MGITEDFERHSWQKFLVCSWLSCMDPKRNEPLSPGLLLRSIGANLVIYVLPKTLWVETHWRNTFYSLSTRESFASLRNRCFSPFLTGPFYISFKLSRNSVPNSVFKYSHWGVWMVCMLFFLHKFFI